MKGLNDAQEAIRALGEDIILEQVDAAMTVLAERMEPKP